VICAANDVDTAGADFDEEQNVDRLQEQRLNGEEVASEYLILIVVEECSPGSMTTLRSRRDVVASQDFLDGRASNIVSQFE
jgi:hypothetical protein